jgi:hypothetical protein
VAIWGQTYLPLAAPANPVTSLVVQLYSWDRFITVGIVANLAVLTWLALSAARGKLQAAHYQRVPR